MSPEPLQKIHEVLPAPENYDNVDALLAEIYSSFHEIHRRILTVNNLSYEKQAYSFS